MNRFTNFTPQQYVESFVETPTMDFPFQETMMVEGIRQKKADDFYGKLGKLEADIPEAGYLTGDLRQRYANDVQSKISGLADRVANKQINLNQASREYNKMASEFKNDPRVALMQQDAALRPIVAQQMSQANYGIDRTHLGLLDPETKRRIDNGEIRTIDPTVYGYTEDPGKQPAFHTAISTITPDIIQGYELVTNEDGTKTYKNKETNKGLDMNTLMDKSTPWLQSVRNEDGTINMNEALDPKMKAHIAYKQAMAKRNGGQYLWGDLVNDYKEVAALYLNVNRSEDISGIGSKGSGKAKKGDETAELFEGVPQTGIPWETMSELKNPDDFIEATNTDLLNATTGPNNRNIFDYSNFGAKNKDVTPEQSIRNQNAILEGIKARHRSLLMSKKGKPIIINGIEVKEDDTAIEMEVERRAMEEFDRSRIISSAAVDATIATRIDPSTFTKDKWNTQEVAAFNTYQKRLKEYDAISAQAADTGIVPTTQVSIPKGFKVINGKVIPERFAKDFQTYETAFKKSLDENLNQEYTTLAWELQTEGGDNTLTKGKLPSETVRLQTTIKNIMQDGNSSKFMLNGKNFGFSEEGLKKVGLEDYKNSEFRMGKLYYNGIDNKYYVTGKFHRLDGNSDEKGTTHKGLINVDVTDSMATIIKDYPQEHQYMMAQDIANDNLRVLPKNTGSVVRGFSPDIDKEFGKLTVRRETNGNYSFYGNMYNPKTGEVQSFQDIKNSLPPNERFQTENLSKEQAADILTKLVSNRINYSGITKQTSEQTTGTTEPLKLSGRSYVSSLGEEAIVPLENVLNTIISKEGGNFGYDAVNQGSNNSLGTEPINSGTATKLFGKSLSDMTIGEVMDKQKLPKTDRNRIFAASSFQIIPSTMKDLIENSGSKLGITKDTKYTAEVQEKLGIELLNRRLDKALKLSGNTSDNIKNPNALYKKLFEESSGTNGELGQLTSEFRGLLSLPEIEKLQMFDQLKAYIMNNPNLEI